MVAYVTFGGMLATTWVQIIKAVMLLSGLLAMIRGFMREILSIAAYVLATARAIGETMIVTIAAGANANFTFNPMEGAATLTAYIAQVSLGDLPHGSIGYRSIFAAGLMLLVLTLVLNVIGHVLRRRYREAY